MNGVRTAEGGEGATGEMAWATLGGGRRTGFSRRTGHIWPSAGAAMGGTREYTAGNSRGPGWRELVGTFSWPDGGSVANGRRQVGSGMARNRARARLTFALPRPALGKMEGEPARRAGEPTGQGEEPSPEGLGGYRKGVRDLLAQTEPGRPAGQVVRHHLDR